ncbi:unnamed protein product [Trichobilharzia szidati]|nr:unnamed protein product [Trichobilharzia szidati]
MFINHDVCNLSSDSNLLSAQTNEQLMMTINKLGCSWSSGNIDSNNCNSCNNYNASCFTPWLSSTTMPYDRPYRLPETDRLEDMKLLQSVKKINVLQDNVLDNKTSNPLDYSLHSQINEHHSSAFTTLISPSLAQSKHNFNLCHIPNICKNNDCGDLSFPWTLNYDVESKNGMSNIDISTGRSLKRKYSESSSNISRKYSQKHMRGEFNKTVVSTDYNKDTVNKNTISNIIVNSTNHLPTSEITNSTTPVIRNFVDKSSNSSGRKRFKSDKDFLLNNNKSMNTPTSSTAVPSSTKANTSVNCASDVSINDNDNRSGNKSGTVTTAAYKYLTWREKDRRRRFREEWKHLWLVIPHGLYEVMCLVCHKVMTQRKLDTIKRHTVRRHAELLKMPESDRQELFDQLFKQHNNNNTLGDSNTNSLTNESSKIHQKSGDTCKSSSKKSSRSSMSNIQGSSEASYNLSNHAPRWSSNKVTETTSVTNLSGSNSIPLKDSIPSHYVPHKREFCSKSSQISDAPPEHTRNFFTDKGRSSSKIPIEEMIDEILNKLPVDLRKQWQDHLELTENIPTNRFLGYKNHQDSSIYPNSFQKEIVNRHQLTPESSVPTTIISSPISSKISPTDCSSHPPISYITPHIPKLENSPKSFATTNYRQSELSTQSSPIPLFLSPEPYPNIHNLDDISNFEKINPNVHKNFKNRNSDRNNFTANLNLNSTDQAVSSSSSKSNHNNSVLCSDSQCNSITNHFIDDFQKTVQNKPSESLLNRVDFSLNQTSAPQTSMFSNITGTTESQTLMLASWFTSLMNAAKTSNQTTYEKISPNLFKPIWNNLSSMEKPSPLCQQFPNSELFNANPCDSYTVLPPASYLKPNTDSKVNSEGKETINSCKKNSDSQSSVNSDLNKFTISSLLSTNSSETTKSIATPNKESNHPQSDISNKQNTSNCCNNTSSDDRHDDICKTYKMKSISDYFESLFYGFSEKKQECSPDILDQIRAYKLNIDLLTKFLTKQINGHYDFTEIRDPFNCEELEAKIRQYTTNEFQAEIFNKESQKPSKLPYIQHSQDLGTVEACMKIYYSEMFRNQFNGLQMNYHSNYQPPAAGCILVEGQNNFRPKINTDI